MCQLQYIVSNITWTKSGGAHLSTSCYLNIFSEIHRLRKNIQGLLTSLVPTAKVVPHEDEACMTSYVVSFLFSKLETTSGSTKRTRESYKGISKDFSQSKVLNALAPSFVCLSEFNVFGAAFDVIKRYTLHRSKYLIYFIHAHRIMSYPTYKSNMI